MTQDFEPAWARSWPPRVISERGACLNAPENSLRAFRAAVDAGADAIALDVMRCGTGEVVVCYERTLARFGGGRWDDVATTSLDTLRAIDLGDGEWMPLLTEVFAAVPRPVLLELRLRSSHRAEHTKHDHRELALIVMALASHANAVDRVLITSEDGELLAPFADAGAATCLLVQTMPLRVRRPPPREPTVVRLELHGLDVATVRKWQARGAAVHVWPANTASQLVLAWSLGVDGVLTNDPAAARTAIDQRAQRRVPPPACIVTR